MGTPGMDKFQEELRELGSVHEPWLYVPIDGVVTRALGNLGIELQFSQIRAIDTRKKFCLVLDTVGEAARAEGVPRVWTDDVWVEPR